MGPGVRDFIEGLKLIRISIFLGCEDIRQRYIRTALGPFWIVLSTCISALVMSVVMGALFSQNITATLPFIMAGLTTWSYIAVSITDGTNLFITSGHIIGFFNLPISIQIYRALVRNFLIFLHGLVITMIIILIFGDMNDKVFLIIPGLFLLMLNLTWVMTICAIFSTRYRDVQQIITILLGIVPFVTPIFWKKSFLATRTWIVDFNPAYHAIEIVRAPLLGEAPPVQSYLIMLFLAFIGNGLMLLLMNKYRNRIVYWL